MISPVSTSILVRKVIRRGSFVSTEDLKAKIESFSGYFNRALAKPFRWTYTGKPLAALEGFRPRENPR